MKRESIENLLKESGVAEDKIKDLVDSVMAENGKDIESEKTKTTTKETELAAANKLIGDLQDAAKKFDGKDPEKLEEDYKALKKQYDIDIAAEKAKADALQKEYSLKDCLRGMGITDPDYLIYKHGGAEKFAYDKDGSPIGLEDQIKGYKETIPHLFKTDAKLDGPKPGDPGGPQPDVNAAMIDAAFGLASK